MLVADSELIARARAGAIGSAFSVAPVPGRCRPLASSPGSVDDLLATKVRADHKAAISKFVAFLLRPKYEKRFANLACIRPVTRCGAAAEGRDPVLTPFLDAMPTVDWLPDRDPAWTIVQANLRSVVADELTSDPKAFLDRLQTLAAGQP